MSAQRVHTLSNAVLDQVTQRRQRQKRERERKKSKRNKKTKQVCICLCRVSSTQTAVDRYRISLWHRMSNSNQLQRHVNPVKLETENFLIRGENKHYTLQHPVFSSTGFLHVIYLLFTQQSYFQSTM